MAKTYMDLVKALENTTSSRAQLFIKEYEEYQRVLAKRLDQIMKAKGVSLRETSKYIDLTYKYLWQNATVRLSLSGHSTVTLCYEFLEMSCQEFIAGEMNRFSPIPLTRGLNIVANALMHDPEKKLFDQLENEIEQYKGELMPPSESTMDLIRERFALYRAEYFRSFFEIWQSSRLPALMKHAGTILMGEDCKESMRLSVFIYLSIVTKIPVDFFLVRDYTQHLPLLISSLNSKTGKSSSVITDSLEVKYIIGSLLRLPMELRSKLIGRTLARYAPQNLSTVF